MARPKGSKNKPKFDETGAPIKATRKPRDGNGATISAQARQPRVPNTAAGKPPELSNSEFRSLLLRNADKIGSLKEKVESATGTMRAAYKAAKADGIPKKDIDLVLELRKSEREDVAAAAARRARIIEWIWPGFAKEMQVQPVVPHDDDTFTEGKEAGKAGSNGNHPYPSGGLKAENWLRGWHAGQAEIAQFKKPYQPPPERSVFEGSYSDEAEDPLSDAQNFG